MMADQTLTDRCDYCSGTAGDHDLICPVPGQAAQTDELLSLIAEVDGASSPFASWLGDREAAYVPHRAARCDTQNMTIHIDAAPLYPDGSVGGHERVYSGDPLSRVLKRLADRAEAGDFDCDGLRPDAFDMTLTWEQSDLK